MKSKAESLEHIIDSYQERTIRLEPKKILTKLKTAAAGFALAATYVGKYTAKCMSKYAGKYIVKDVLYSINKIIQRSVARYHMQNLYKNLYNTSLGKYVAGVKENITGYIVKAGKPVSTLAAKYIAAGIGIAAALATLYYYYKRKRKKKDYL